MPLTYGSVCSGIEAASVAWEPLGWKPKFFAEIEKFPSRVLAHHYGSNMPGEVLAKNGVPNHGDFTRITAADVDGPIDILVGGTPCQSFSVAGKRLGLDDPRGNLALEYLALARRLRPRWIVWENVPGVLSSFSGSEHASRAIQEGDVGGEADADETRDFAEFLSFVRECGYGFAWRILDAQYVRVPGFPRAVPQRRRRVFLVGYSSADWRCAAAVLFDRDGLRGDPPPRRQSGQGVAGTLKARPSGGGGLGTDFELDGGLIVGGFQDVSVSGHVLSKWSKGAGGPSGDETQNLVAHALRGEGFDASEDGTGRGTPIVPVAYRVSGNNGAWETGDRTDALTTTADPSSHVLAFTWKDHGGDAAEGVAPTLRAMGQVAVAYGFQPRIARNGRGDMGDVIDALSAQAGETGKGDSAPAAAIWDGETWAVRRLTPLECERLQGFPDNYTGIPGAADGPRYKALGNSMAVNVMEWIGRRIALYERLRAEGRVP